MPGAVAAHIWDIGEFCMEFIVLLGDYTVQYLYMYVPVGSQMGSFLTALSFPDDDALPYTVIRFVSISALAFSPRESKRDIF